MSDTIIDDADPAAVYSGKWVAATSVSSAYDGTTHMSNTLNDKVTFTFQGTGILVNSGPEGPATYWRAASSYSIDGGTPTVYTNNSFQTTTEAYSSATLPNGQHTLTVINLDTQGNYVFLDYFIVLTANDSVSTSSSANPSTSATTAHSIGPNSNISGSGTATSASSVHAVGSSASGSTLSDPTPSSAKDTNQIPLILGPIMGAIAICGLVCAFLVLRRRRKRQEVAARTKPTTSNSSLSSSDLSDLFGSRISTASQNPIPIPSSIPFGQKPSLLRSSEPTEPPPYIEDPQSSSRFLTSNRLPAKLRSE